MQPRRAEHHIFADSNRFRLHLPHFLFGFGFRNVQFTPNATQGNTIKTAVGRTYRAGRPLKRSLPNHSQQRRRIRCCAIRRLPVTTLFTFGIAPPTVHQLPCFRLIRILKSFRLFKRKAPRNSRCSFRPVPATGRRGDTYQDEGFAIAPRVFGLLNSKALS